MRGDSAATQYRLPHVAFVAPRNGLPSILLMYISPALQPSPITFV